MPMVSPAGSSSGRVQNEKSDALPVAACTARVVLADRVGRSRAAANNVLRDESRCQHSGTFGYGDAVRSSAGDVDDVAAGRRARR